MRVRLPLPIGRPVARRVRAATVRRTAAVLLALAAVGALVGGRAADQQESIVVAARELRPGVILTVDDLQSARIARGTAPHALRDPAAALGGRVTGAVAAGEALSRTRLLTSRLPQALTGDPTARLVPVRPSDAAVAGLLRTGDVVDVLDDQARVLAADGVVALPGDRDGDPVLLALGRDAAHRVAGASLSNSVTLVLH